MRKQSETALLARLLTLARTSLGDRLGVPPVLSAEAPARWLAVALVARGLGLDRLEAVAVGRYLKPCLRAVRA